MGPPAQIKELVERFGELLKESKSSAYNEALIRKDFVDPLFRTLGWDVNNEQGLPQALKDVIREASAEGSTKAPDYCFRSGGRRRFFVEAKKPSLSIEGSPSSAYQLRRYAWSAKLSLSILTDFEEFAVYDCRPRPHQEDAASKARILYLRFSDYPERWSEIAGLFSKDAVLAGSLERYSAATRSRRGSAQVDEAFLEEIEGWRASLAKNLAEQNAALSQRELNYAVQATIDRLIFLRMCEDRRTEDYGRLREAVSARGCYKQLLKLFAQADQKYNSGLFYFDDDKSRGEAPDTLTPTLEVGDATLKSIVARLYYPESPYEFSVLPTEILGQVYERFLGKVIKLTDDRKATIEEKPEVRKAGGVYYTPSQVVDHLVERTMGVLVEGKAPAAVARLRILDPACGSGSFLLGAYQFLLDWHLQYYRDHDPEKYAEKREPKIYRAGPDDWRLTAAERKRILVNNIYGVDLDPQAVEVAKLSLLLKLLESETQQSLERQRRLYQQRALPALTENIKCGNSLIDPQFFSDSGKQLRGHTPELLRIKAFNWAVEFKTIMERGGFDAVIGNPPYLSYSGRQAVALPEEERRYFSKNYATGGWLTSHGLFIEQSVRRLAKRRVSFIVPGQVGHLDGYAPTREQVTKHSELVEVRYWGEEVFADVVTPALTFVTDKKRGGGKTAIFDRDRPPREVSLARGEAWVTREARRLIDKLREQSASLEKLVADPGVHTGNCSKKIVLEECPPGAECVPVLEGKQVSRYRCLPPVKVLRLDYPKRGNEYFTIRPKSKYSEARFVIRQTAAFPIVGPRRHAEYFRNSLLALYSPDPESGIDVRFYVGLLNSALLRFVYAEQVRESQQKAFPQVKVRGLRALPMYRLDLSKSKDQRAHAEIVSLVQELLDLNERLESATTGHEQNVLRRQLESADKTLDEAIYRLYELGPEEVALVDPEGK